jgi:hypothetical protein
VHRDLAFGTAPIDRQLDIVADPGEADHVAQLGPAAHRDAVYGDNQIAAVQPGTLGGRPRLDAGYDRTRRVLGIHRLREVRGQVLDRHADAAALHRAVLDDLLHDAARHVDRYGEPDADIAAAGRQDRGVDADALPLQIN